MEAVLTRGVLFFTVLSLFYIARRMLSIIRLRRKVLSLGLPMFKGLPLVGNSLELCKLLPGIPPAVFTLHTICGYGMALRETGMFIFNMGPYCYVVLAKPELVEKILLDKRQVNKSDDYDFYRPWLGNGLITSSYAKWKEMRKKLSSAFHSRILEHAQQMFSEHSEDLVDTLGPEVGKAYTHLGKPLKRCALDILSRTVLGVDVRKEDKDAMLYLSGAKVVSGCIFRRIFSPWFWPHIIFRLSSCGRTMYRNLQKMSSFLGKVISQRKEELNRRKEEILRCIENIEPEKLKVGFLDIMLIHNMLHEDEQFSEQEIKDQVNTFTLAGHETTSSAMYWTLYLLGLYPEVQEKVYEELEQVFLGNVRNAITLEDVNKMLYLERVIKESLRLYPAVTIISRKLTEDFEINDVTLPKGVTVVIPVHTLHRDPENFPEPEVFDPDRFLSSSSKHPFAYIPFSAGPRDCIGRRFAMLEIKTILANLLRNFKVTSLEPRDKVLFSGGIVSGPHKPIKTKLETR